MGLLGPRFHAPRQAGRDGTAMHVAGRIFADRARVPELRAGFLATIWSFPRPARYSPGCLGISAVGTDFSRLRGILRGGPRILTAARISPWRVRDSRGGTNLLAGDTRPARGPRDLRGRHETGAAAPRSSRAPRDRRGGPEILAGGTRPAPRARNQPLQDQEAGRSLAWRSAMPHARAQIALRAQVRRELADVPRKLRDRGGGADLGGDEAPVGLVDARAELLTKGAEASGGAFAMAPPRHSSPLKYEKRNRQGARVARIQPSFFLSSSVPGAPCALAVPSTFFDGLLTVASLGRRSRVHQSWMTHSFDVAGPGEQAADSPRQVVV
jgi:hypothetical protein